jgi:hypothetical protein
MLTSKWRELRELPNAVSGALRIGLDKFFRERAVAERGGEKDVGRGTARKQHPRRFRSLPDQPLRGRRIMIVIARIDGGAAVEEHLRDLRVARKMQRRAAVSALRVNQRWIGIQHPRQMIRKSETGGRVDRKRRPALHEKPGEFPC